MSDKYKRNKITAAQALRVVKKNYGFEADLFALPGEVDFNFKLVSHGKSYLLKISRPSKDKSYFEFQNSIIQHLEKQKPQSPKIFPDLNGNLISETKDKNGQKRFVRLLSWIEGRPWSKVNPILDDLLFDLGKKAGSLSRALENFHHPQAHRQLDWDIAQAHWIKSHLNSLSPNHQKLFSPFLKRFDQIQKTYEKLRKAVVHNDVNDNNILVSENLIHPKVNAIIDFGDALYTQIINDLAITIAYGIMNKPDPLRAALPIVEGYHQSFPLQEKEIKLLYVLVGIRLLISLSKADINKELEPDNQYLLISQKPAQEALEKWAQINENLAHYSFRKACKWPAHPNEKAFTIWARKQKINLNNLFPDLQKNKVLALDMEIGSSWLGQETEFNDNEFMAYKIQSLHQKNPKKLAAGGYLEIRPLYITDAYKKEGNSGSEYRSTHLGIDFWAEAMTPIHAPFDGKIISVFNNNQYKDYGPTLILEHYTDDKIPFYTLYGHCSKSSLKLHKPGENIKKGELLAYIGRPNENGSWAPHTHFQLMLDRLGYEHDFPGVAFPKEVAVWKSICPDPNLFFKQAALQSKKKCNKNELIQYRKDHLGKSLSLSYDSPIKIIRGRGAYLIDEKGKKYLDTVNNVAHVGHEHPEVVRAGQNQMGLLNTNTRYLHENITNFAKELLSTFPEELSVVHFVNSGSEANELALRMASAYSKQKDIIAVEEGYHGNTNACIAVSSYKFDGKGGDGKPEYTHIVPLPDTYRGLYRGKNTAAQYAAHIQEQIENIQRKGRNVAAFICESIISCGGQIELPKGYLALAYKQIRKAGGLCIADEVQTGCGRMGSRFWGFQLHEVTPDIVSIGKPIGNGHPLAAVVCTKEVADAFANGMEYFNTFGGNPVSCAIGREVLRVVKQEKLQENALKVGSYLKTALSNLQKQFPILGDVRGQGLFLGFEFVDKNKNPLAGQADYLANRMKELGVLMSTDGKDHNVLKIKPPLVFSIKNADELIVRLKTVLNEDFMMNY
jgi:4-aminobutyrate aminotransferase-like enzyme/Ser/Thr protein kinase RdoA (MazF antagonist)